MSANLVLQAVRRSNLTIVVLGLICIGLVVAGIFFDQRQLISSFSGPHPITNGQLSNITDSDMLTNYWVNVTGSDASDTGWQQTEDSDSGASNVTASYVALLVGKRYLLVQLPRAIGDNETLPTVYTGTLIDIPDEVNTQVMADIRSQNADIAALFLPVMLDTSDFRGGAIAPLILIALGTIIGLALLVVGTRRIADPNQHPIMKALARYGDPQAISEQISQEVEAFTQSTFGGTIRLTPHWLVSSRIGSGSFQAARLQDVVWCYEKITRQRTYGITTRRTYQGYIWDQYGKLTTFSGKEADVKAGLQALAQSAPWAIFGYDKQIDETWRKNRAQFLASIKQRREQAQAH